MSLMEFFDNIPLSIYLSLAILGMILLIEFGYRGGMYRRGYFCRGIGPGHGSGSPAKPPVQDEPDPDDRSAEPHQPVIEADWLFYMVRL